MTQMAKDVNGESIQALALGTVQNVAYTGTAGTVSNAVGATTKVVRVLCTTDAHVRIAASPTAVATDTPVAAWQFEYFNVIPGSSKVSAIQNVGPGTLFVTEML